MPQGAPAGLVIAGGGLSGCLTALALAEKRPDVPILLVEEGERFGGNHIWSFFDSDVAEEDRWLVEPLVGHHWPGYRVAFPGHSRQFATGYNSIRSERLNDRIHQVLRPDQYRLGTKIRAVRHGEILLESGERIGADGTVDARGAADLSALELGWQKFVGREYRFERPHGLDRPVVMDATVEQIDGYRFVYCLPFDDHRMLVEDTYYSNDPVLDPEKIGGGIDDYVAQRGWSPGRVEREETGVLPVAMGGDFEAFLSSSGAQVGKLGLRGGLFHPTTGYSLPDAVRSAAMLARQKSFSGTVLGDLLTAHSINLWEKRRFYRMLGRMMFRAAAPAERYKVLERFYLLGGGLIERFYAGRSTALDRLRILTGKPPVPIGRALSALWNA